MKAIGALTIPMLEKQLADVDKAIANLLDAIQQGMFNTSAKAGLDDGAPPRARQAQVIFLTWACHFFRIFFNGCWG